MQNTSAPRFCDSVASSGNDCDRVAQYAIEADGSTTYACAYHWEHASTLLWAYAPLTVTVLD